MSHYYMGNNSPEILESILDKVRRDEYGVSIAAIGTSKEMKCLS